MSSPKSAVAIIGISAELPSGAHLDVNLDHKAFFSFLLAKGDAYEDVPAERFDVDSWHGPNLGQVVSRKACFLKNITEFDHTEFGITAKDANAMAISTRKLLEHSFLALQDSGIDSRGQNVGVYMSGTAFDVLGLTEPDPFEARGVLSGIPSMIANKVSYHLDLTGPSIPMDTACSSTLTALHLATQALRAGECESAIVGGSQINNRFIDFIQYSQSSVLAPDGKCKPFDAAADGFSRGEGVVVIVVKLLEDAIRDGDHIYASILGTAVNATGSAAPVYAPVAEAQWDAMRRAFKQTDRSPSDVDFVELHATGTAAGDPVEANWVGPAFARSDEMLIGSVKGNIGHLEITAFLASLSKVCSIFETGLIPPNVNFSTPNPAIRWKEYNMRVPMEVTTLGMRSGRSLIAMNSSGIGGSNGHVILEAPPPQSHTQSSEVRPVLLVAGGLSPQTASLVASAIATSISRIDVPQDFATLSTIYGRRARQLTWRTFATWIPGQKTVEFPAPTLSPKVKAPIVFVFAGQGPQHFNMGRQLFRNFEVFRASIYRMDRIYQARTGKSLIHDYGLFDDAPPRISLPEIWPIAVTQPALVILEMALYDLFIAQGVYPDVLLAHSAGETPMLYASGAVPQEMAVEIGIARGVAMKSVEEFGGAMAAVACTAEQANAVIQASREGDVLEIGCYNSPEAMALSGSEVAVDRAVKYAKAQGFLAVKIKTHVAGHSSLMERCRDEYQSQMFDIYTRHPGVHIPSKLTYSTQTGRQWTAPFTAEYMWSNARNPVYFAETISTVWRDHPNAVFVEISPHPVLTSYISGVGVKSDLAVATLRRSKNPKPFAEVVDFLRALGTLMTLGCNKVDFDNLNGPTHRDPSFEIAPYPFNRKHVPYLSSSAKNIAMRVYRGPLNYEGISLNSLTHPDMAQHVIRGEPILPATGYIEMIFEAGARNIWDLNLLAMLPLLAERTLKVDIKIDGPEWSITSTSSGQPTSNMRLHAAGYMSTTLDGCGVFDPVDIAAIQIRCQLMDIDNLYATIEHVAQYGPLFRRVEAIYEGEDEVLLKVRGSAGDIVQVSKGYVFHPAILDACIHAIIHPAFTGNASKDAYYLPSHIGQVVLHDPAKESGGLLPSTLYSYIRPHSWTPDSLKCDVAITNGIGVRLCSLIDCTITKHLNTVPEPLTSAFELVHQPFGMPALSIPVPCKPETMPSKQAMPMSLDGCVAQVRVLLMHATRSGKRLVRLLQMGNASESLYGRISALSTEFEALSLDYNSDRNTTNMTRHVLLSADNSVPALPTYDIIIVQDMEFSPSHLSKFLIPGGFIVVGAETDSSERDVLWQKHLADNELRIVADFSSGLDNTLTLQRISLPPLSPTTDLDDTEKIRLHSFQLSDAFAMQAPLRDAVSTSNPSALWFESTIDTCDGAAALGFTRSLRQEIPMLDIRLVLFAATWSTKARYSIIKQLNSVSVLEQEMTVDASGMLLVPRILSTSSPQPTFDPYRYWQLQGNTVHQHALPDPGFRCVMVKIHCMSKTEGQLQSMAGTVVRTSSARFPVHSRVVGIVSPFQSNFAVLYEGQLAPIPSCLSDEAICTIAVPLLFVALATQLVDTSSSSADSARFFIVQSGEVADKVIHIMKILGHATVVPVQPSTPQRFPSLLPGDVVLFGCSRASLAALHHPHIRLFDWSTDPYKVFHGNPRIIGDTIHTHLHRFPPPCTTPLLSSTYLPEDVIPGGFELSTSLILSRDKFYIIIGGVGSLGLHIASWMYHRGARHVVTTSRSGLSRLTGPKNRPLRLAFQYLRSLPDLDLRVKECDASSSESMRDLLSELDLPIAGCVLASAVQTDGLFLKQTEASFKVPFTPKIDAFRALETNISISSLEFFVSISSIAVFGAAGQTNYSSANSGLDQLIARYPNAFSFVAPLITDSTTGVQTLTSANSHLKVWEPTGMSSSDICKCLEDGILRLRSSSAISTYIPMLNWDAVHAVLGSSPLYEHLLQSQAQGSGQVDDTRERVEAVVLNHLDVSVEEFDPQIPLTSYGLDSLAAARLSIALKPYLAITQMQLLADLSLDKISSRLLNALPQYFSGNADSHAPVFPWEAIRQTGQTVIKLVEGYGTPLFIVHGGAGDVTTFKDLQGHFQTPLWAVQVTDDAPIESFNELVQFYYRRIKEAYPFGGFRLAGFSASSLITLALGQLLEQNGDDLVQLIFIDHFPLIFASPLHSTCYEQTLNVESARAEANSDAVQVVIDICSVDPDPARRNYGLALVAASKGETVSPDVAAYYTFLRKFSSANFDHVVDIAGGPSVFSTQVDTQKILSAVQKRLIERLNEFRAPIVVYVASDGLRGLLDGDWKQLGVDLCRSEKVRSILVEGAHFEIFGKQEFANRLEHEWTPRQDIEKFSNVVKNPAKNMLQRLFTVLDSRALQVMAETLAKNPSVGSEISRQRYYQFAVDSVKTSTAEPYSKQELETLKAEFGTFFEMTERVASVHTQVFQSAAPAVAKLYSDSLMDGFYVNNPSTTSMCLAAVRAFTSIVSANEKPFLRILEVGVGGLTTYIVDAMGDLRDRQMEYTVSDMSPILASRLAHSFKHTAKSTTIASTTYDISKTPSEQGLALAQFDVILGLNVIHAAPDLKYTLECLYSLLAPGGHLLAVDLDGTKADRSRPGKIWMDYIFGSFPGWFGFTDDRVHCSQSPAEWGVILKDVGFADARFATEDTAINLLIDAVRT